MFLTILATISGQMATRYRFIVIFLHANSCLIWSSQFLFWWDQPIDNFYFLLFWPLLVAMVATTYSCDVILLHVNSSLIWSIHFLFWWDDTNNNFDFSQFWPLLVARWPPVIDLVWFFCMQPHLWYDPAIFCFGEITLITTFVFVHSGHY